MAAGLDTRPTAITLDVEQLTAWAWSGRIRIPHFQRPLRWQRGDVIRLFDSIVRGYPVGSFLLWRRSAPAERLTLGALRIDAPAMHDALWVVDGQQRIISLANALDPRGQSDPRFRLAYDLRSKKFVPTPDIEEPTVIPLPVIFNLREVLRWFAVHDEAADYVDDANEITRTLRQFKIPAYEVSQEDQEVLQDIFDRMNSYGKRLSRAEIFSALFPGDESARDTTPTLDRIAENIDDDLGFGLIDNGTILQAVLARRGPDVLRGIRNEFGEGERVGAGSRHERTRAILDVPEEEDRDTAYALGEEAIRRAVTFLQDIAGVPHFALLPYRYLLVVLTRIFAHYADPDQRTLQLIRRWFWRAAVVGPEEFRGSTSGTVRQLSYAVKRHDLEGSIQRLLSLVQRSSGRVPDLKRFRSNEASTKVVLCSWWSEEPRDLMTDAPFERSQLSECLLQSRTALDAVRYIISRYSVPRELRLWAANRVLYPTADSELGLLADLLIQKFSNANPSDAVEWQESLSSHCLSLEMVQVLKDGNVKEFLFARQAALESQLENFLATRCEWGFEDTPPLDALLIEDEDESVELSDDSTPL